MGNKTYEIRSSWDEEVFRVFISGTLVKEDAIKIAQTIAATVDEHKPGKVLIDCTGYNGRLSSVDTIFLMVKYEPGHHRPSRVAVLDNPENKDIFSFQEKAGRSVGLSARYFCDLTEALRWLQG